MITYGSRCFENADCIITKLVFWRRTNPPNVLIIFSKIITKLQPTVVWITNAQTYIPLLISTLCIVFLISWNSGRSSGFSSQQCFISSRISSTPPIRFVTVGLKWGNSPCFTRWIISVVWVRNTVLISILAILQSAIAINTTNQYDC